MLKANIVHVRAFVLQCSSNTRKCSFGGEADRQSCHFFLLYCCNCQIIY